MLEYWENHKEKLFQTHHSIIPSFHPGLRDPHFPSPLMGEKV